MNSRSALLQRGVFVGNLQLQFDGADCAIGVGDLCCHQHLQIVILRDAGKIAGIRSLDAAPEFAPEIDFPADAETGVVGREGEVSRRLSRDGAETVIVGEGDAPSGRPHLTGTQDAAGHLLLLRVEQAACDHELRTRLQDAHPRGAHIGIDALRLGDIAVQHGVAEIAPPLLGLRFRQAALFGRQRPERAARPAGQPRHLGALEIRPNRSASTEEQRGGESGQSRSGRTGEAAAHWLTQWRGNRPLPFVAPAPGCHAPSA